MDFYFFKEITTNSNVQWEQIQQPTLMEEKTI